MTLTAADYVAMGYDEESAIMEASRGARLAANSTEVDRPLTDEEIAAAEAAVAVPECNRQGRWGCSFPAGHDGDCVKACVNHFWKRLGEGTESCPIVPAYAKYGHLCGSCFRRAQSRLRDTIGILSHIRSQVAPSMESARGPRVSGTREAPIPLNPTAAEDSHDLFQRVNEWMAQFDESLGLGVSLATLTWLRRAGERLPDFWSDPYGAELAMTDIVSWYEQHEHTIVTMLPPRTVAAWTADIGDMVTEYRGRYKLGPERIPRVSPRPCPECKMQAVRAHINGGLVSVRCDNCETVLDPGKHAADITAAEHAATITVSLACDRGRHTQCGWVDCPCDCHTHSAAAVTDGRNKA